MRIPEYRDVWCDFADDIVMEKDGFCNCCGATDHQEEK